MTNQPTASATELLNKISSYVQQCYRDLEAGKNIDLSGLDDEVGELCKSVAELPAAEAEELQPHMQELMAQLKDLGKKLDEIRSEVKQQLQELNLRQKANKAYSANPPAKKPDGEQ